MNYTLVGAALLALAVVATGAVAAAPGNAPMDTPIDNDADQAENERQAAGPHAAAQAGGNGGPAAAADEAESAGPASAADDAGQRGPPADLPGQVPDFVGQIHSLIQQHIDGSLDGTLGDRVSNLMSEDDEPPNETAA